jgi:hypothetical protein
LQPSIMQLEESCRRHAFCTKNPQRDTAVHWGKHGSQGVFLSFMY